MSPERRRRLSLLGSILLWAGIAGMGLAGVGTLVYNRPPPRAVDPGCPAGYLMVPLYVRHGDDPRYGCVTGVLP